MQDINLLDPTGLQSLETLDDIKRAVELLRNDFDFHNHDGSSSRALGNVIADSVSTRTAIIGGYKLFEAVVGKTGADYKSVAEALQAGKTRIFVRDGIYTNEARWVLTRPNTVISGESKSGVNITFAVDSVNAQNIRVDTPIITIDNMTLTAYESTVHALCFFTASGILPTFTRLILRNKRGPVFEGDVPGGLPVSLWGTFRDIRLDMQVTLAVTTEIGFLHIAKSIADNILFDMTGTDNAATRLCSSCSDLTFTNCKQVAGYASNNPLIESSTETMWIGCSFYCCGMTVQAHFRDCIFQNDGNDPETYITSDYFLTLGSINSSIKNSKIKLNAAYQALKVTAGDCAFDGNYIDGGKKITVDAGVGAYGVSLCNNIWKSDYASTAIDLTLSVNALNSNVLGNIFHGHTNVPTITNTGGATNNVVNNQLFQT